MRILLAAMPDTADFFDFCSSMPNLALVSLAGNLPGHQVKVLDLVAHRPLVRAPLERAIREFRPQLVGLSAMIFQWGTLLKAARLIRSLDPDIALAAGGYHVTTLGEDLTRAEADPPLDFLVRGEGEITFRELAGALEAGLGDYAGIKGLAYRHNGGWRHNPPRELADLADIALPDRGARLSDGFHLLGSPLDVAELSRGCPHGCRFCSITNMYGHTHRKFSLDRIVADLKDIRNRGARTVFLADDNIACDVEHFRRVCRAIAAEFPGGPAFITQIAAASLARHPDLAGLMARANFQQVFVGFEAMDGPSLAAMQKPTSPEINRKAAEAVRRQGMALIASCIFGYPDDDARMVRDRFRAIKGLKPDAIYALYLTPYPRTALRGDLMREGLVENPEGYDDYDGFHCNVRTRRLSREQLYRALRRQTLLANFDPRMIAGNWYLKHRRMAILKTSCRVIGANLRNLLTGRQQRGRHDL